MENQRKPSYLFVIALGKVKCPEITLSKEVGDLHNDNLKTPKKEIGNQEMEGSKLTDWQNQYCENGYITESDIHINTFPPKHQQHCSMNYKTQS